MDELTKTPPLRQCVPGVSSQVGPARGRPMASGNLEIVPGTRVRGPSLTLPGGISTLVQSPLGAVAALCCTSIAKAFCV
ncbi:hypothetical protein NCAST_27_00260 [Nocardia asteroides NBRC 15531]|uniref:Uncharacterized protein n=1 Tax=Nocardia asteroides NBRC 15531 TaxID=1110697 RepID=U5EJA9_NOCAS|nr:hypothetical protein NCAST_27_00260 [Nocardia asteroides NBRC 15531]